MSVKIISLQTSSVAFKVTAVLQSCIILKQLPLCFHRYLSTVVIQNNVFKLFYTDKKLLVPFSQPGQYFGTYRVP